MIREKEVELLRKRKGAYFIFRHVPAGVCRDCGTRYYAANTLKLMAQRLEERKAPKKKMSIALLDLAAA